MKKWKIFLMLIIFITVFFVLPWFNKKQPQNDRLNNKESIVQNKDSIQNLSKDDKFIFEDEGLKISSIKTNYDRGMYEGFLVENKGVKKSFDWESIYSPTFTPKVIPFDNKQHLLITTVKGEGTGLYIEEAHILESESLKETFIENPIEYIKKHITSKILKDGQVIVYLDYKEIGRDNLPQGIYEENLFDEVAFGNIVRYEIYDDILYVEIGSLVSPGAIFCSLGFTYEKDDEFMIENVTYIAPSED